MLERDYQAKLIKKLRCMFKGCFILKNDSEYCPGVPDLLILYEDMWAMLEVKTSENAKEEPNQPEYVDMLDHMSFAAFIYPENEEEVLSELKQTFRSLR